MDISFVIVNYQSKQYLRKCLLSLSENVSDLNWEVIIINNDQEKLPSFLGLENIRVIENNVNNGFAKACNLGAKNSSGNILFFLNPDTELLTSNISEIKKLFSSHENAGIISPRLITADGTAQEWSAGLEITLWDIIKNNLGLISSKFLWNVQSQTQTDWVSGAALAIRRTIFEDVSGYDENFFMYFEDVDLCKRVSALGKKVMILPSIKVMHLGGQSATSTKKQKFDYYASQDYYFKKHFGKFQLFLLKILRYFSTNFQKIILNVFKHTK